MAGDTISFLLCFCHCYYCGWISSIHGIIPTGLLPMLKSNFLQIEVPLQNQTKDQSHRIVFLSRNECVFQVCSYGFDGLGGMLYIGSACFHRRESLTGRTYGDDFKGNLSNRVWKKPLETVDVLEERGKFVASCASEENTLWGTEVYKHNIYLFIYLFIFPSL